MINPTLFQLLERRFGEGRVRVCHADEEMRCAYVADPLAERPTRRLVVEDSGEEFQICCPFCGDTRQRLTINHRWGVKDPVNGRLNLWLAQCFNEQCLSHYENQRRLYDDVVAYAAMNSGTLQRPDGVKKVRRGPLRARAPGPVWPLEDMLHRSPRHPALAYLRDRLLDPLYLSRRFGVGYLPDADYSLARNRLYAPIYMHGKLAGWQVRCLGKPPEGEPKWWSMPKMAKEHLFYNYDQARCYPTKVLVEGPPATWGFGPQARGLLGKSLNEPQRELLEAELGEAPEEVVVVLLDPDQSEKERAKGQQHHIERACRRLLERPKFRDRVLPVYLPSGTDPADLDREYMYWRSAREARGCGLRVSFSPYPHACAAA